MTLYFEDNNYELIEIATPDTEREAIVAMQKYLEKINFKSYYTQITIDKENNRLIYDFGSHTEFFILEGWEG